MVRADPDSPRSGHVAKAATCSAGIIAWQTFVEELGLPPVLWPDDAAHNARWRQLASNLWRLRAIGCGRRRQAEKNVGMPNGIFDWHWIYRVSRWDERRAGKALVSQGRSRVRPDK